ncbi:MAG: carbon monoxide dehydrogenase subunit G [Acidobacteria bacterium]|nr:carbon monoxide dehydrogenase subunit G [Acidobacteriota bacterium]
MELKGTYRVKASRERVWAALNDPAVLRQCAPGCKRIEPAGDDTYDVLLEVGIAAVKGKYSGKIKLSDIIPPVQYKLAVTGSGSAGFVNAEGLLRLQEAGSETVIEYSGKAQVGGLIAGIGQRVVEGVAKYLVGPFFQSLEAALAQPTPANSGPSGSA